MGRKVIISGNWDRVLRDLGGKLREMIRLATGGENFKKQKVSSVKNQREVKKDANIKKPLALSFRRSLGIPRENSGGSKRPIVVTLYMINEKI